MTTFYILTDLCDDVVTGIFSSKEKLIHGYKSELRSNIEDIKINLLQNPKRDEFSDPVVERFRNLPNIINHPCDELFEFFINQKLKMPKYIRNEVEKYRVSILELDIYYS